MFLPVVILSGIVCQPFAAAFCLGSSRVSAVVSLQAKVSAENGQSINHHVVVVGGGWAGFSAADALASCPNTNVTLMDASPRGPGGLAGGWRTPKLNRPVEAGVHGFWREYRNAYAMMRRIGLDEDEVLTPYTPSVLISESGRVALAPVLGEGKALDGIDLEQPPRSIEEIFEYLPPPLDIALGAQYDPSSPLTAADRFSGLGLLGAWSDFEQEGEESWDRYDKISADSLFRAIAGISPTLYRELVLPLLHVLPMTTAYDCSAAAALSCFHVFALQSRGAFDVRWCRGSIAEKIFNRWVERLASDTYNVKIRGSCRVQAINRVDGGQFSIKLENQSDLIICDSVVLAIGATSAGKLVDSCPPLKEITDLVPKLKRWRGVTCVAVRLFLSSPSGLDNGMKESPVAVCGPNLLPELVETGFCIYNLSQLQEQEFPDTFAVEVDYFRADDIADLDDDDVVDLSLRAIEKALEVAAIPRSVVEDFAVVRARDAVSHFCVGSASNSPATRLDKGLYMCGDWTDRTGHASWSTEKAVVTGIQAAQAFAKDWNKDYSGPSVLPAANGSTGIQGDLNRVTRSFRSVFATRSFPVSPWSLLRSYKDKN